MLKGLRKQTTNQKLRKQYLDMLQNLIKTEVKEKATTNSDSKIISNSVKTKIPSRVTKGMTDAEKYEVLKNKRIKIIEGKLENKDLSDKHIEFAKKTISVT